MERGKGNEWKREKGLKQELGEDERGGRVGEEEEEVS